MSCGTARASTNEESKCAKPLQDTFVSVDVTATVAHQEGVASPFDEYPLFGGTFQNNEISRISESDIVKFPKEADKYFAYFSIFDARYGHNVTRKDGLFKRVIEALEILDATEWDTWKTY